LTKPGKRLSRIVHDQIVQERLIRSTIMRSVNMSIEAHGNSQAMHRTGWILSGIVIAVMAADAGSTLLAIAPIKKAALETGYPLDQMWLIGALQLICLVLYAIPTTGVLGAIVVTGFLGGAITSHLRVAGTLTPEMIVSLILGVTAWGGLWFRDPRIRALIPAVHSAALVDASRSRNRAIS
jgi:hypothetical protein